MFLQFGTHARRAAAMRTFSKKGARAQTFSMKHSDVAKIPPIVAMFLPQDLLFAHVSASPHLSFAFQLPSGCTDDH